MKATIEFTLPDERDDYIRCVHANDAWNLLYELDSHLRSLVKHGEGGYKTPEELADFIRRQIGEVTAITD